MPELPEVEVTRASLADRLHGAEVRGVRLGKPLRWPLGVPADHLLGRRAGALQTPRQVPVAAAGPVHR